MASKATRRDWSLIVAWGLVIALILGGFALIVMIFGGVTREEFSPQTFQRRESTYFRIPIVSLQVTPVMRKTTTNSLESQLNRKGLIKPNISEGPPRWDLVSLRGASPRTQFGDAAILCRYLDTLDAQGDLAWRTWSVDHPKISAALWPLVALAAREKAYQAVPGMLDAAQKHKASGELDAELRNQLAATFADRQRYHAARSERVESEAAGEMAKCISTVELAGGSTASTPTTAEGQPPR